jgi:hypothetical protein
VTSNTSGVPGITHVRQTVVLPLPVSRVIRPPPLSVHVTVLVVGDGLLMVPEQSHPERPLEALEQEALSCVASCEQVDATGLIRQAWGAFKLKLALPLPVWNSWVPMKSRRPVVVLE